MSTMPLTCMVVSDFTVQPLVDALRASVHEPRVEGIVLDGPVESALIGLASGDIDPGSEVAFVWTRPEAVLPSIAKRLVLEPASLDTVTREVESYAQLLKGAASRFSYLLAPTWVTTQSRAGLPLLSMTVEQGWGRALLHANAALAHALDSCPNIHLLDAAAWRAADNSPASTDRLWLRAKVPYSLEGFRKAAESLAGVIRGLSRAPKKLIVLDLDDTIWGGILGEVGQHGIRIGGHDPVGEAFREFQTALKAVSRTGVLLAIASKNAEAEVLEALSNHPEMVLRPEDFVAWRINRDDKASNILAITQQLNIGLDSVVFIDDHPAERDRVKTALPEVFVPEWPLDPTSYRAAFFSLPCFDRPYVTAEDRNRAQTYAVMRATQSATASPASLDEWLKSLETIVSCEELNESSVGRAAQLLNKTNQMNLTTRRLTEKQLLDWSKQEVRALLLFRVKDNLADYGITGLVGLEVEREVLTLTDFVLSCRVFGRGIEEVMVGCAIEWGRLHGAREIVATYRPTERNRPVLDYFRWKAGWQQLEQQTFRRSSSEPYSIPPFVSCSWPTLK